MNSKDDQARNTVLTFKNGRFVLIGNYEVIRLVLQSHRADNWQPVLGIVAREEIPYWYTTSIEAACLFKAYADERAKKIFERAFIKYFAPPTVKFPRFLDPHQIEGVLWALTRSRSYLAHAPGAGKTCEAIVAAMFTVSSQLRQVVFIVPPSLTMSWAYELCKFYKVVRSPSNNMTPSVTVIRDSSHQKKVNWSAEFLIVPDSMLTRSWVLDNLMKLKIRFLSVDEASRFKDPRAERSIALFGGRFKDGRKSSGLIYKPKHAVLLDGSPMPNRPMELWAPAYAMNPECIDFLSERDFGFKYCGPSVNERGQYEFKHSSNEAELNERITRSFMHVVTEEELNHPERRRSILHMSADVRSPKHKTWEKKNLSSFSISDIDENASQGDIAKFRCELGIRKVPWIAKYVADRLNEKNESILLFAWHRLVIFELQRRLSKFNPGVIMGGVPEYARERDIALFQEGKIKLLIINIAAGGRGYNLQRADRVIFGEFSWSDEMNKQCEKRASRKGNDKAYTRCEYIVSPGSMDEPILNAVFRKAERVKKVIK